ncbi:MAG: TlyA family RNA methyltransferase [Phycisphaerae bacterium]|nr:TlyA family RNA methyltransferase [Phycisphaerae bacterium]
MTTDSTRREYVSRAGLKLAHALGEFRVTVSALVCADLGSNAGGFVDCLLQAGAARVYAIERGYGIVDYRIRTDPRVVVMERTDALHARLPEPVDLVTIDAGWTRQARILPAAVRLLKPGGAVISLVKPHYEAAPEMLDRGVLMAEHLPIVLDAVRRDVADCGLMILGEAVSPILGHGGNREILWHLRGALS